VQVNITKLIDDVQCYDKRWTAELLLSRGCDAMQSLSYLLTLSIVGRLWNSTSTFRPVLIRG
jgi:hypothetical protein